jgi:hypothetical protein
VKIANFTIENISFGQNEKVHKNGTSINQIKKCGGTLLCE